MNAFQFAEAVTRIKRDFGFYVPETVLSVFVCILLLHDVVLRRASGRAAGWIAAVGTAATLLALWLQVGTIPAGGRELFGYERGDMVAGMMRLDNFGLFFKALVGVGTLICIPMAMSYRPFGGRRMGEFYAILLGAALGMFVMVSATNLVMFFLGIEFASLASYLLTAFLKRDMKGSEAGLKYAIYGSVASGIMAFGISIIYGLIGSLHINDLAHALSATGSSPTALLIASVLVFAGFAYKMAAFPMHFWCPDVYEGAPTPFTAFLSVTSKAAGFAMFVRFIMAFGPDFKLSMTSGGSVAVNWGLIIQIVSVASMTLGNLAALAQTNLKRMLAYSSIAHAG